MPFRGFLVLLIASAAGFAGLREYRAAGPGTYLIGDCPYYAATSESVLFDGDFDLANQLAPGTSGTDRADSLRAHDGFFSVGPDGRIVPKHSTLMPLVSVPFRAVFGRVGFLVFNVLQTVVLVCGIAALGGGSRASRIAALAGYGTTPFLAYTFNYSPDVFGTALVVWAYVYAARGKWVGFGLLAGLAVWAKVYLPVILLPGGLLALWAGWRALRSLLASSAVALLPMLVLHTALYGGPLATGYDCEGRVLPDGSLGLRDHYSLFHQPVGEGLRNLLFDDRIGLLLTAPLWAAWPLGAWSLSRRPTTRPLAWALGAAVLANLLLFARYDEWDASVWGNRFLFPALAIGLALLGPMLQLILKNRLNQEKGLSCGSADSSASESRNPGRTGSPVSVSVDDSRVTASGPV